MSPVAKSIRKIGYRRWYERQLVESHLWLVTCVVALVMTASGMELFGLGRGAAERVFDVALILSGLMLSWVGWRRYARLMMAAQFIGEQADCPSCGRHGFRVGADAGSTRTLDACCPRCAHHWPIALPPS